MAIVALTQSTATGGGGATVAATGNTSLTANTNTYTFVNDGKTMLCYEKGSSACTATVVTPGTVRGVAIADPTHTIAASTKGQFAGPFAPDVFNDSNGLCSVTFSEVTGLIVYVVSPGL